MVDKYMNKHFYIQALLVVLADNTSVLLVKLNILTSLFLLSKASEQLPYSSSSHVTYCIHFLKKKPFRVIPMSFLQVLIGTRTDRL